MSGSAVFMMMFSIVIVWGGLIASIVNAIIKSKQ